MLSGRWPGFSAGHADLAETESRPSKGIPHGDALNIAGANLTWVSSEKIKAVKALTELKAVMIFTTDLGPWQDDVFLVLDFGDEVWLYPSEHPLYSSFFDELAQHLDMDYSQYIQAMRSADNQTFLIWPKVESPDSTN